MEPETPAELFAIAVAGEYEGDAAWDAVNALRRRGGLEILNLAKRHCQSGIPLERARGLDVLAQLDSWKPASGRIYFEDCIAVALRHLHEEDPLVANSAAWALTHLGGTEAATALIGMRRAADSSVRRAVAVAMYGSPHPEALETLLDLLEDADGEVRNWAAFAIGDNLELDSSAIRSALRARLPDSNADARSEAIWGLARRHDPEGLQLLLARFDSESWIAGDEWAAQDALKLNRNVPVDDFLEPLRALC